MEQAAADFANATGKPVLVGRIAKLYGPRQNLSKPQGLISHICRTQGVEGGLQEEVAAVLAGPDVDEGDVGGDAGDPSPLIGEAMVLAMWVPCPLSSTLAASLPLPPSMSGRSVVKFRESSALKFGAMSRCVPSMPVSMTPTMTRLLPRSTI